MHTNYAIRILMYCNTKKKLSTIREISKFYGLSETFLAKILVTLTRHGFIDTVRGRGGGILLAYSAKDIRIGDVVRKVEENFELAECFQPGEKKCPLIPYCGLNEALSRALESFFDILNEYTLDDFTQKKHSIYQMLNISPTIDIPLNVEN